MQKNKSKVAKIKTEEEYKKKGEGSSQSQVPKPQEIGSVIRNTVHIITQEENMTDSADFRQISHQARYLTFTWRFSFCYCTRSYLNAEPANTRVWSWIGFITNFNTRIKQVITKSFFTLCNICFTTSKDYPKPNNYARYWTFKMLSGCNLDIFLLPVFSGLNWVLYLNRMAEF